MANRPQQQGSLFGAEAPIDGAQLVAIQRPTASLSKAQKTFNRLTGQIRKERERLAAWEAFLPQLQGRLCNEMVPLEQQVLAAQRRLLEAVDGLLCGSRPGERLRGKQQAKLMALLEPLLDEVLAAGPDPELDSMRERHGLMSRQERDRVELEFAESMIGAVLGEDALGKHSATSIEELMAHLAQQAIEEADAEAREREARAEQRRSKRARPSAAEQAAERRAEAAKQATASVREVYRKLASSLHPDREADAGERQRKTALMQRVNQAYERNDLLALLGLQIEIEQIDLDHLANAPEARLQHYNQVLREQLSTLQQQVQELAVPLQMDFALNSRSAGPEAIDKALSAKLAQGRRLCQQIEIDLRHMANPKLRRLWIDQLPL